MSPKDFFNTLYHRFLCAADVSLHLDRLASDESISPLVDEKSRVAAFVEGDPEEERELCIKAMAAVYTEHAGVWIFF